MDLQKFYPQLDEQKIYHNFLEDLQKSAKGEKTSLRFIHNKLPRKQFLPQGTKIQVLVIGGTICRSAIIEQLDSQPKIRDVRYITKPVFPTKEIFLDFVSPIIDKDIEMVVINSGDTIAPILENGVIDGILVEPDKENKMEGLKGEKLGETIAAYYFEKKKKNISVSVVNDTVCLLLCGLTKYRPNELAAGIVGTGVNAAIFLDETTAINLEAGGFSNFPQSEPGKYVNDHAEGKGEFLFQKEVSGAYLYMHFNYLIKKQGIIYPEISQTVTLTEIVEKNIPEVSEVAEAVLMYSATLFACQVAGIVDFLQKDLTFVMEGSLFWLGYGYRAKVEEIVKELTPDFKIEFVQIPESDIVGGAKVLL